MESAFYQNVFLLTQAVPPSTEFLKYFKEGMFDKPNTIGFLHASQYLLTIYDANRFKKTCKWPLHCKKDEAEFRTSVKDFLTCVARENPDIDFPQILASHLLHASGLKFSIIMWNLSTVTLRTYIKKETGINLLAPKSGVAEDLSRMLLSNITAQSAKNIEDIDKKIATGEQNAKIYASETAESIQQNQEDLFLTRRRLMDMAPQAPVHPAMKNRLSDPNDTEVIQIWKKSVDESSMYLKRKQERLKELADLSNSVAAMVTSIATTDSNMLDGNRLPAIETDAISEADRLSPETQISLHRLRANGSTSLEDVLQLVSLFLADLRRYLEKQGFPDVAGCDSQVRASREDMNSMSDLFRSIYERIVGLSSELKIRLDSESASHKNARKDIRAAAGHMEDNDIFDSVLLKSSPTININHGNHETERSSDVNERLELTPVENIHKALFSRHMRKDESSTPQLSKLRPKLLVSRINFDDSKSSSCASERMMMSPVNRMTSTRLMNQSTASCCGKYSRLFSTYQKKSGNRLNSSILSVTGSWRNSTVADASAAANLYSVSELRPHLTTPESKYIVDTADMTTPTKQTPVRRNANSRPPAMCNDEEKRVETIAISQTTIDERSELTLAVGRSPKVRQPEKMSDRNRRTSISDLVERYKRVREKTVDVTSHLENSSDVSDESGKH